MVSFENVSKFILSDVSIHIPKGSAVGIIGASGAGKTTFMKLACGLLEPDGGNVYTMGKNPVINRSQLGRKMSCFFTGIPVLNEFRSVRDNFKDLQIVYQISDTEFEPIYSDLATRFGFDAYEYTPVKSLSLGQRRRAELGAVLLQRPELLLLDEPANGLDENAKTIFRDILQERVKEGMTLLITSHDMKDISQMCDRIMVLNQGKMLFYGNKNTLMRKYAPMDIMIIQYEGAIPDLEDLPLSRFSFDRDMLSIVYNSNYITSAEILDLLIKKISIREVNVKKPGLEEVILEMERMKGDI
ncbi:MAG: ABC transporter ATP-binding protein [Lachnospiraceae bacterium]|nr:ABC transporter ATP-binding protein [Lachnospiraceae bacterium]